MPYLWEHPDWPRFTWDARALIPALGEARHRQGRHLGAMAQLGFELQVEAEVRALTEELVKSSAIEGESLDAASVRSSFARRLGAKSLADERATPDRHTEGLVDLMLDATQHWDAPLTAGRLHGWHASLFPTGYSGLHRVRVGGWRDDAEGPMEVVSGPIGRRRVHFRAPPADRLDAEMARFLTWFDAPLSAFESRATHEVRPAASTDGLLHAASTDGLLHAALAHLWLVTLHPLDDGNGRVARAVTELALARLERSGHRFYSMSSQLRRERRDYYERLERAQRGSLDVTEWLAWFLGCYTRAVEAAEALCQSVLDKASFWRRFGALPLNDRQRAVLSRVLDDFEGKLTAKKWAALGKCSIDTAQRDLTALVQHGVLLRNEGGARRTSYRLSEGGSLRADLEN